MVALAGHTFDWLSIKRTAIWLTANEGGFEIEKRLPKDQNALLPTTVINVAPIYKRPDRSLTLEQLITLTRGFASIDPRDKIMALLDLASPRDQVVAKMSPDFG